jgi:hypothetical protein
MPVVNPREGELLAGLGAVEDIDYAVWRPVPEIEILPSTIAHMGRPLIPPIVHAPYSKVPNAHRPAPTVREKGGLR